MCARGTKQRYVLFSVYFKTALFKYVTAVWSGFSSANLNLFCSWHFVCCRQAATKNIMFAQKLLKVFGKDCTFPHQVTEMSSEFGKRKSWKKAHKDMLLWLRLLSGFGPSPSAALTVQNCILLCDFQISSADVPFLRNITRYLLKERIESVWIHSVKHRTVNTSDEPYVCLKKFWIKWMNVYINK